MDKLRLLKSVVLRTKSFKALLLGGLIISFVIIQFPSDVNKEKKMQNYNFKLQNFESNHGK